MASGIQGTPNTYDFGLSFNYQQWTAGTVATLCNVPWNNDYRDIMAPAFLPNLDNYIDGLPSPGPVLTINKMMILKMGEPIRLDIPFNTALNYNYLRVQNPAMPVKSSFVQSDIPYSYYYFITDIRFLAPNTTELMIQLDVWSTFGSKVNFGNCYIERGHIGIANENQFNNYGRDYLTVPEGLDTGSEYVTVGITDIVDFSHSTDSDAVLVLLSCSLLNSGGTSDSPRLVSAGGCMLFGIPSGAEAWIIKYNDFTTFALSLADCPWISQCIISMTVLPAFLDNFDPYYPWITWSGPDGAPAVAPIEIAQPNPGVYRWPTTQTGTNWRESTSFSTYLGKYATLKKFMTSPYLMLEMTAYQGTPIILRPENWFNANMSCQVLYSPQPSDQKIMVMPLDYNSLSATPESGGLEIDGGDFLDTHTLLSNFPSVNIINNNALLYLADNKNQIAWAYSSADWSEQKALHSNDVSYDQAMQGIKTANKATGISNRNITAQNNLTNWRQNLDSGATLLGQAAQGAGAALSGDDPIGGLLGLGAQMAGDAASAAMSDVINTKMNNLSTAQTVHTNAMANQNQQDLNRYLADTNKSLADWAARGDYANAVGAENAKVRDSRMLAPSVSGQAGGATSLYTYALIYVTVKSKMLDPASVAIIGNYWFRYGYKISRFIVPPATLMCCEKFTYWKMMESYLVNTYLPEWVKQAIRGIFEKGVTVWAKPSDIGTVDITDNPVIEGISY